MTRVCLERDGNVALLVLDGAPRNELSFAFFDAFGHLVHNELPRLDIEGLIITGRGRHFSSGSSVAELYSRATESENGRSPSWCETHAEHFRALSRLPYPVVAAVSGCCLGSGLELALSCHYRVSSDNALFALPEAQHGLIPGLGGAVLLAELIGFHRALGLCLSGGTLDAREALELGVVDSVISRGDLEIEARRIISCNGLHPRMTRALGGP